MSNLQNILHKLFLDTIHLHVRKIVSDSVRKLAYDIPTRNLDTSTSSHCGKLTLW